MKTHWTRTPLLLTAALLASCFLTAWMAVHGFYINMCLAALLTLGIAWAVCRYMKRTSRLMEQFIQSVRYSEFPEAFGSNQTSGHRGLPPELLDSMQNALEHYRTNLQRKEGRLLYFQALANHIDTAILVYTPQGNIEWKNEAATRLLATAVNELQTETWILKAPKTVDDLRLFHPDLPRLLRDLRPGSLHVIQVHQQEEGTQLALSGMEFILQGRKLVIASLKNIHSALEHTEMEAWQKLIRVLTHEIMNSITPIISLSETLSEREMNEKNYPIMKQGMQTIHRRSKGLLEFVENYRKLTRLPSPVRRPVSVRELLLDLHKLYPEEYIHIELPQQDRIIQIDRAQIEQVLINLIKNAMEACGKKQNPRIDIKVVPGFAWQCLITVSDNGDGILPDVQDKIFVPFFSTKPNGSGIGLSLCKQIMNRHGGNITVQSVTGQGCSFTLEF